MTTRLIPGYGSRVDKRYEALRDIIFGGLVGIGFVLNLDHVAAVLPVAREAAAQLATTLLVLFWLFWLFAALVWFRRLPR